MANKAAHYRSKAQVALDRADKAVLQEDKVGWLKIAEQYFKLAEIAEKQNKEFRRVSKSDVSE